MRDTVRVVRGAVAMFVAEEGGVSVLRVTDTGGRNGSEGDLTFWL